MAPRISREIERLRAEGLYRSLKEQQHLGPNQALIEGRRALLFAGNDYLGLASHPEVAAAGIEAQQRLGSSAAASRLISGNVELYGRLEAQLARLKGQEAALVFSSGYLANLAVLSTLAGSGDTIYMDRLNHASLYDGWRLSGAALKRYGHGDVHQLERQLKQAEGDGGKLIVSDGVFSMDGDLAPLPDLERLAAEHGCLLVVDDAHGTGVLGPEGRGSAAHLGVEPQLEVGTLSKALGALGGFVAGPAAVIELLVNKARPFIFSTGLPPATLASASAAVDLAQREEGRRERLVRLGRETRIQLRQAGFTVPDGETPILPVIVGGEHQAVELSRLCLERGVFIPAVRTPAVPKNQARLRLTLSALHSDAELEQALAALTTAGKELKLI